MKLTRGLLPAVQAQETIRSDKYNKDIEVLIAAHNSQEEKLVNAEFKDVAGQVNTYAELIQLSETTPDLVQGTRIIVVNDENTGKDYVTYVYNIDLTTGELAWVVSSVGVPLATNTSDGLLSAEDYDKLQEFQKGEIPAYEARIRVAEAKAATNEANVTALTSKVNTNTSNTTALTSRVTTAEGSIGTLNSRVDAITGRVTTIEGSIGTFQSGLTLAQSDITAIKASIGTVPAAWNGIVAKIGVMDNTTAANKTILDTVKSQADLDHIDISTNIKPAITANTSAIEALKTRVTTAEGKLVTNKTAIDANTADIVKLKAKDTVLEGDVTDVKSRLGVLEAATGASGNAANLKSAEISWYGELAGSAANASDNSTVLALNTLTADNNQPFSFAAKKKLEIWLQVESTSLGVIDAYVKPIVGRPNNQSIQVVRAATGAALEGVSAKLALDGKLTISRNAGSDLKMNTVKAVAVSETVLTAVNDLVTKTELATLTSRVSANEGKITELQVGVVELAYKLNEKYDKSETYSKAEVDAKLGSAGISAADVDAKITAATSSLATAASVTALTTTVNDKADTSTVSALTTRVTTAEGALTTLGTSVATNTSTLTGHGTRITAIETKDGEQDIKIAANKTAIDALGGLQYVKADGTFGSVKDMTTAEHFASKEYADTQLATKLDKSGIKYYKDSIAEIFTVRQIAPSKFADNNLFTEYEVPVGAALLGGNTKTLVNGEVISHTHTQEEHGHDSTLKIWMENQPIWDNDYVDLGNGHGMKTNGDGNGPIKKPKAKPTTPTINPTGGTQNKAYGLQIISHIYVAKKDITFAEMGE